MEEAGNGFRTNVKFRVAKLFFGRLGCAGGEAAAGKICRRWGAAARLKPWAGRLRGAAWALVLCLPAMAAAQAKAQSASAVSLGVEQARRVEAPPRVREAERFLAARGWAGRTLPSGAKARSNLSGVMYGLKPVPFSERSLSAVFKARSNLSAVMYGLKPVPFGQGSPSAACEGRSNLSGVMYGLKPVPFGQESPSAACEARSNLSGVMYG
ncbi:MAG: hypothetical protein ACRD2G_00085, partial [Terriglobia bacterium]